MRVVAVSAVLAVTTLTAGGVVAHHAPRISLSRPTVLFSQPVTIRVTRLDKGEKVTVRDLATSAGAAPLSSQAMYRANSAGVVDLARSQSEAGTYAGRDRMGLFWSLQPGTPGPTPLLPDPLPRVETDQLSVEIGGKTVATRRLVRRLVAPGVTERQLRPDDVGFYGDLFAPTGGAGRRPAVLVLGGSEGGLAPTSMLIAAQLASHGYPTLALAYFGEPGLPSSLMNVPLEYFETALRWLSRQPGVDAHHIVVSGASRGSEAALLLGVHNPDLVSGVIAASPSSVVNRGLPDKTQSAWSLGGSPIAFVPDHEFREPLPADAPDAIIPVELSRGPILFVCGHDDHLWPSCDYTHAMTARLAAADATPRSTVLRYPAAGHSVGELVANTPESVTVIPSRYGIYDLGGSPSADAAARADAWPRLLLFLKHADRRT